MNFLSLAHHRLLMLLIIGLSLLAACDPSQTGVRDPGVGIITDSTSQLSTASTTQTVQSIQGSQILSSYSGSYALLIGESQYTNGWSNLESIPGELRNVKKVLQSQGFKVEMSFNLNAEDLTKRFNRFINQYGFKENNRLLFFYSGHGHTREDKGYIVPTDAANPNLDEKAFLRKAVGMNQILTWARRIEAKHVLFLFDSCFSGTVFKARNLPKMPRQISQAAKEPVRQFITAGSANEVVPAKSVFTPAFIDALRYGWGDLYKDGYVTGEELGLYLKNKVPLHSAQTPQYGKIEDYELSRGDFVFFVGGEQEISKLSVSLEVKIGQMLIVGFRGMSVRDPGGKQIIQDIQRFNLGGVILYDHDMVLKSSKRNIKSPAQVKSLVKQLQVASQIPLFIAIDQEGGKIRRLKEKFGFPRTVSAQNLGKKNNLALTYQHASQMAKTLANLGINFNFAPVVDLNTNPNNPVIGKWERSFSADPQIVTKHARKFIKAHHAHGVLCSLKHFPGHGSSTDDSHLGMVDVTNTWVEAELEPYQKLINADKKSIVDAIMIAHVFNRRFDSTYPATLSKRIVTGLLRDHLGYDGVIVSDDMQMKAITNHYRFEVAIQKTLEAGIDLIVIGNNLKYESDAVARTVGIIKQLIQAGKITEARIDESYRRIQQLKRKL